MSTLIFILMMVMYLAIVLYSPCLALSSLTDINLWLLVVVAGAICVFYTTLGGMKVGWKMNGLLERFLDTTRHLYI